MIYSRRNGLGITTEANKRVVNFLDVTPDSTTGKFKPYSKATTSPLYVPSKPNHPPNIIRNIPEAINRRLSEISSDEDTFTEFEATSPSQNALKRNWYSTDQEFKPAQLRPLNQRIRRKNMVWFKPPFNKNVQGVHQSN